MDDADMDDASLDGPATLERALRRLLAPGEGAPAAGAEEDEGTPFPADFRESQGDEWRISEGPVLGQSNAERIRYRCGARHKARSKKCKYYGMAAGEEPEVPRDDTDWRDWEQASGM
ncbi:hypothetical protein I350_08074 [Cryptococcus amylolentus CBS 6273]|uniref:Uncharacterized protein n=1 Tax=Cryptococcus amylolentus CBS 6273 TaxID=1296118 RepID=A0A1E3J8B5_9TREE|nr:hypothetical protein I350_08074 [Cryptococcus amylolentus CBS 6273]